MFSSKLLDRYYLHVQGDIITE